MILLIKLLTKLVCGLTELNVTDLAECLSLHVQGVKFLFQLLYREGHSCS